MIMVAIERHRIEATLTIDSGDRQVELHERAYVPAAIDPEVIELAVIGRLMHSAAGRYRAQLDELLAPLRAVAGDDPRHPMATKYADDQPPEPSRLHEAVDMWRSAALALLDAYLTGQPLNFNGHPIPDAVRGRLDEHFARQPIAPDFRPAAPGPADEQATALIPAVQSRRYRNPGEVPIEVGALAYATNHTGAAWFVHESGLDWRSVGPDADGTTHTLHELFGGGDMIEVDRRTGAPV